MEKNEVIKENIDEIRNQFVNGILGFIPGGHLNEFQNFHSNLIQKRLLHFCERLKNSLEAIIGIELTSGNFNNETFSDIVEIVFNKVKNTRSEYKLEQFKNILLNQILEPKNENPLFLKYIQLLDQLDDVQIVILNDFRFWHPSSVISIVVAYEGDEGKKLNENHILCSISEKVGRNVTISEVEYYTNELVSLGLVKNNAQIITAFGTNSPQNKFRISTIGLDFLSFIELN